VFNEGSAIIKEIPNENTLKKILSQSNLQLLQTHNQKKEIRKIISTQ
jgi:hypothetical protein